MWKFYRTTARLHCRQCDRHRRPGIAERCRSNIRQTANSGRLSNVFKHDCASLLKMFIPVVTNGVHAGFARLTNKDHCYISKRKPNLPRDSTIHGPARLLELRTKKTLTFKEHISVASNRNKRRQKIGGIFSKPQLDLVFAIRHPSWPNVASEWISRAPRYLASSLVKDIVKRGCHLVEKPHPNSTNCTSEWRFSFSVADTLLIKNWSSTQRYVYHILRLTKKEVMENISKQGGGDTFLSTYYFKMMMLWQSEEEPQSFWDLDVEFLIDWLISRMIHWISSKQFPHYFIRSNNLLDHVNDTHREVESVA